MSQIEMVALDSVLPSTHPYRRFQAYLPVVYPRNCEHI